MLLSDKQYSDIGRLMVVEMDRNRNFRRTIEALPLGATVISVIERDETFRPSSNYSLPTKTNYFLRKWRRFKINAVKAYKNNLERFRIWNQQEI